MSTLHIASIQKARERSPLSTALALVIAISITLCVYGYQFGHSNHTIYLLDALHRSDPKILARDWFTTQTFQYHAVFGWIARGLMRLHCLEAGFLVGYLALIIAFHIAWMRLVILLGGTLKTYLVSILMYYVSAGGTALGMYQFFQDSAFLASNIANVLLLCAIVLWIDRRGIGAGVCIGMAGLFHLNYALVGSLLWLSWIGWDAISAARRNRAIAIRRSILPWRDKSFWIATTAALAPGVINIACAASLTLKSSGRMPLDEFVALYVRFRHPHHYDPRSWPAALWVSFLWPMLPAIGAYVILRRTAPPTIRRNLLDAAGIFLLMSVLLIVALLGAGFWYVSEALVQMSFYRFSIYIQLFACVGASLLVCDCARLARPSLYVVILGLAAIILLTPLLIWAGPRIGWISVQGMRAFINHKSGGLILFAALSCAPAVHELLGAIQRQKLRQCAQICALLALTVLMTFGWNRWIGLTQILEQPDDRYLALCDWARQHTPVEAIFLVPPQESEFRYRARRAIVVNFKAVPQLSGELAQWRDRLQDVLGISNLTSLPRGFDRVGAAMGQLYATRSADALIAVAHHYHAGYIVTTRPYDDKGLRLVRNVDDRYLLYAVTR
jgi:hypothetical protein